jgi:hypothetical protein
MGCGVALRVGVFGLVLVLAGCVTRAESSVEDGGGNRAVVDVVRTSEVLSSVREAVRVAFTVESSTIRDRAELIEPYVTPAGAGAVDDLMGEDVADAGSMAVTAGIRVEEAAVSELAGDRASVAVFGTRFRDDTSLFRQQHTMMVGVLLVDGVWRIDSVGELAMPARAAEPAAGSLAAERDSAIDAGRTIAAELIAFDEEDPSASIDRRLSVATDPLAGRLRAIPSDELETWGTKQVDPATSFGAVTAVERGRATVLLAMSAENVNDQMATPYRHLCWINLVRDQDGDWKARDFRDVETHTLN